MSLRQSEGWPAQTNGMKASEPGHLSHVTVANRSHAYLHRDLMALGLFSRSKLVNRSIAPGPDFFIFASART